MVWLGALVVHLLVIGVCLVAGPIGWVVLVIWGGAWIGLPTKTIQAWGVGMTPEEAEQMVRETDAEMERAARSENEVVDKVRKQRRAS